MKSRGFLLGAASLAGVVVVWALATAALDIPKFLLPSPADVFGRAVEFGPSWGVHLWGTVRTTLLGFGVAVAVGILLAIIIVHSRILSEILTPVIVVLQIVPKIAFAPLFLIWLGTGDLPIIVVAFLVAFFPVVVNTTIGLADVEPDLLDLTRILGLNRWRVLWTIRMPSALPHVFAGLRVASTLAVIGAIIGEFVGSSAGLGYLVLIANNNLDTSLAIASIVLIFLFGLALYGTVVALERISMPWKPTELGLRAAPV